MSFEVIQLADPQIGMYRSLSQRSEARRAATWARFRRVNLLGDDDPLIEEGVTDLRYETDRFAEAIAVVNGRCPAFVVVCGDLVNNPDQDDQAEAFQACIGSLAPNIPLYCVPGNHDLSTSFKAPTSDGLSAYRSAFGDDYYAFQHEETLVLALNSETLYDPGELGTEAERQLEFVDDTLSSLLARTSNQVMVLMHRPLIVRRPSAEQRAARPKTGRMSLLDRLEAFPRPVTVFSGHLHQNRYCTSPTVAQVTSGPVGFPLRGVSGLRTVRVGDGTVSHEYEPLTLKPSATV